MKTNLELLDKLRRLKRLYSNHDDRCEYEDPKGDYVRWPDIQNIIEEELMKMTEAQVLYSAIKGVCDEKETG